MTIQWLGHSCFLVACGEYAIVIDPYADGKVPGLSPLSVQADEVLISHGHNDHCAKEAVRIRDAQAPSPFTVTRVHTAHDDCDGQKRGMNVIHVLEAQGIRVAHFGDLGHLLTAAQQKALGRLDVVMIPVGGHYTIGAEEAKAIVDTLSPTIVLPMHYRSEQFGFPVLSELLDFERLMGKITHVPGDSIEITADMPRQTVALGYHG